MAGLLRLLILIGVFKGLIAVNIKQIIDGREELKQLKEYMKSKNLPLYRELASESTSFQYTFFAPHNDAFGQVPPRILGDFNVMGGPNLDNIFKYHTVLGPAGITTADEFDNVRLKSIADDSRFLFLKTENNEYYVNGAHIVESDINASNGVVHIIDRFLYQPAFPSTVYNYIYDQATSNRLPRTSKFKRLLNEYNTHHREAIHHMNGNLEDSYITAFIPSDDAFTTNQQAIRDLETDIDQLKQVIERHLIIGKVYHTSILDLYAESQSPAPIVAMDGNIEVKLFKNELYVSNNNCGGHITMANITLANGVVHVVDSVIGWQYADVFKQLQLDDDVREFSSHIQKTSPELQNALKVAVGSVLQVSDQNLVTVFAPINSAFNNIQQKIHDFDITQNTTHLDTIMKMHILSGAVAWSAMVEGKTYPTKQPGFSAKFTEEEEGTYVEVDHMRARIVRGDVCTKNGLIHYVDRMLGVPFMSIMDEIEVNDYFVSLYRALRDTGMEGSLMGSHQQITFFAPVNTAFEQMRAGKYGRQLLDPINKHRLQNVLKRHTLPQVLYLDSLPEGTTELQSDFGSWKITRSGNKYDIHYGSMTVTVLKRDIKMVNGVMHIISGVIYDESEKELQDTAGATCWTHTVLTTLMASLLTWTHTVY